MSEYRQFLPPESAGLPLGGDVGDVLIKRSATDLDASWEVPKTSQQVHYGTTNPAATLGKDGDLYFKIP